MEESNNNIKICPFLNQDCIKERCALWTQLFMAEGQFAVPKPMNMCSFIAMPLILGTPRPMPQAIPINSIKQ